jgi:F-type H+-transporting ATPase subunit alpha
LAQFRELEAFAQFGSELDKATLAQLARGQRMVELLKQGQFVPMSVEDQIISIFAGVRGFLDDIDITKVGAFEKGLLEFVRSNYGDLAKNIVEEKVISEENEKKLGEIIKEFKTSFASMAL